jgi:hypothetical protein
LKQGKKELKPANQHPDFGEVCIHSSLKRQCYTCELEGNNDWLKKVNQNLRDEIDRLKSQNQRMRGALERIKSKDCECHGGCGPCFGEIAEEAVKEVKV